MNFQIGDHVICVNKKGKDHLKVGNVRVVQAFNHKIKVCFEDGTESKLQAANNFEYFEDGKRKRGQGEEDDNNLQKSAAAMRMLKFKANQSEEEKQQAFRNKDVARKREKRKNNNNDYSNDDNNNSNNNNISHISAAS